MEHKQELSTTTATDQRRRIVGFLDEVESELKGLIECGGEKDEALKYIEYLEARVKAIAKDVRFRLGVDVPQNGGTVAHAPSPPPDEFVNMEISAAITRYMKTRGIERIKRDDLMEPLLAGGCKVGAPENRLRNLHNAVGQNTPKFRKKRKSPVPPLFEWDEETDIVTLWKP